MKVLLDRLFRAIQNPRLISSKVRTLFSPPHENRQDTVDVNWVLLSDQARKLEAIDPDAAYHLHYAVCRMLPQDAHAHYRLAHSLLYWQQREKAVPHLEQAVRLDAKFEPFWTSWLQHSLDLRDTQSVLDVFDEHISRSGQAQKQAERALFLGLFRIGRGEEAVRRFPHFLGPACHEFTILHDLDWKYSIQIEFVGSGYKLAWGPAFLGWPFLLERLFSFEGYLSRLAKTGVRGKLQFNLGDAPEGPGYQACFSGCREEHVLIPDPNFLSTNAYAAFARSAADPPLQWAERVPKLYWRGSLTGHADTISEVFSLPRVILADMGLQDDRIDARITDLSQFGPFLPELELECHRRGLLGPREPETSILNYKYLIDVDGNTNSWPGLFTKLLSGSPVIKLSSNWRQWYYDRLDRAQAVQRIDDLRTDLLPTLDELMSDQDRCLTLIANAKQLVSEMTVQSEYHVFEQEMTRLLTLPFSPAAAT